MDTELEMVSRQCRFQGAGPCGFGRWHRTDAVYSCGLDGLLQNERSCRREATEGPGWASGHGGSTCEDWGKAGQKPENKGQASWKQKEMVLLGKVVAKGAEWGRETELAGDLL